MNEEVKNLYNDLFNSKEALSEDEFLDKLIKIENITKYNIFRNLLTYTDKNNLKDVFKLYGEQIVKSKSVLRNKLERQSLNNLIGENITIGDILDKYIQRIKTVFSQKTSLDDKLSSLKITYDYIDGVIFPPEGDTRIIPGSGKGLKVKEGYDRVGLLFNDILNVKNNIYLGDFRVVIGEDDRNSLRDYSYVVIEIPKLNKTIFVNNKYGEATYIYDGIPTDKELLEKGKESLGKLCTKISFHNADQWKKQVSESLFKEGSTEKKSDFKNIKAKNLKDALNMEGKREAIRTILNEKQTKEKRFSMDVLQRVYFKLSDGTNYVNIARIFGFKEERKDLLKIKTFIELSKKIFGDNDSDVINLINSNIEHTESSIRDLFKDDEQLKEKWFSLNYVQRIKFKLSDGTSYINIARIFGLTEDRDILLKDGTFIKLCKKIFGEDDPDVINLINNYVVHTDISIRNLFKNDEQLKKQWFSLNNTGRKNFKLNDGTSYVIIARIFGFTEEREDLEKEKSFIELSKRIFGDNNPNVISLTKKYSVHTVDSIRNIFIDNKQLKEKRFSLSSKQRLEFKLNDRISYYSIARIFGFTEDRNDLIKNNIFIELSKKLFGENDSDVINLINSNIEHTTDSVKILFANNTLLKKQWFSLNSAQRIKFKLNDGTSYITIARIFGFTEDRKNLYKDETFIELSKKIFGEKDSDVINLTKQYILHTPESIKNIFVNNKQLKEKRFSLSPKKRVKFKLDDGTSYITIARIFGFTEEQKNLYKDEIFIELSKRIFGENDSDVSNLTKQYILHTPESIKNIFVKNKQLKEKRFSLSSTKRARFKLNDGTSYHSIARIFGFTEERKDLIKNNIFIELSKRLFGENDSDTIGFIESINNRIIHTTDSIKELFKSNKQLKEKRFSLNFKGRYRLKLPDGTSYSTIARIFGFTEFHKDLSKDKQFLELSKRIFGEDDPDVVELAKRLNK